MPDGATSTTTNQSGLPPLPVSPTPQPVVIPTQSTDDSQPVMPPVAPADTATVPEPQGSADVDAMPQPAAAPQADQPVADDAASAVAPAIPAPAATMPPVALTMPVTTITPAAPAAGQPTDALPRKKILVVEDENDAREMFVDLLQTESRYDVSSSADGIDALAKLAADKFDLVLLDIVMPNKDGIEVLQEIKSDTQKYGTPVVVMLTNISGDAAVEKAKEIGAAGFKLKIDTEPEELLRDVAMFLAGQSQPFDTTTVGRSL